MHTSNFSDQSMCISCPWHNIGNGSTFFVILGMVLGQYKGSKVKEHDSCLEFQTGVTWAGKCWKMVFTVVLSITLVSRFCLDYIILHYLAKKN